MGTFVNAPVLDYLTLTTFDGLIYQRFVDCVESFIEDSVDDLKPFKIKQYEGIHRGSGSVFLGLGSQSDKPHFMVQSSGASAQNLFDLVSDRYYSLSHLYNCSRLDLQVSLPLWNDNNFSEFANIIKDAEKITESEISRGLTPSLGSFRGKRARWRSMNCHLNSDGLDTLYIGSRSTGRYIRIYVKEIEDKRYLRFEVEYSKDLSKSVFKALVSSKTTIANILLGEVLALPPVFDDLLPFRWFLESLGVSDKPTYKKSDSTMERRWAWLINQVVPSIEEMMLDRDYGAQVEQLLQSLIRKA